MVWGLKPEADARAHAVVRSCLTALSRTSIALRSSFLCKKVVPTNQSITSVKGTCKM